ncbi:MAG: hypothetical protein Fur0034_14360 [Desulfuromonadia bacterium]
MARSRLFPAIALLVCMAGGADAATAKKPYPVYWVDVSTSTQSIPGMGGGGFIAGLFGKKLTGPQKEMMLRLVSPHTATEPKADHLVPAGFSPGPSLPLRTPAADPGDERVEAEDVPPPMEKPKARLLIYWGCGETVRKGQPKILDTASMTPAAFAKSFAGRTPTRQSPPSPKKGWTYARWPERERGGDIAADSSLVGEHRVEGSYLPVPIQFSLSPAQDFMAPVEFSPLQKGSNGSLLVSWKPIPTATAYYAVAMGHDEAKGETILWSSSEVMESGFGLLDYLTPSDVARFTKEKVLLPPQKTSCGIPPVFPADGGGVLTFIAYGEEQNFSRPPRPKAPKKPWNPDWTVKVRYKSTAILPLITPDDSLPKGETKGDSPAKGVGDAIRGIFGW